jgi:enoyl-CoA hydratase/carnithine racemase
MTNEQQSTWTVDRRGSTAVLTFRRPPRNLMSFLTMGELYDKLDPLTRDETVSVVMLTGGVPGYFVAHADVDDLSRFSQGQPAQGDPESWRKTLALLEAMPQPVVAAIHGQAWGGGCEIAMACTLRIASQSSHFSQPEIKAGIIPGGGGTQRMPRLLGPGRAAELILSGRVIKAEEAKAIGLIDAVLPDEKFLEHAHEWVGPIASRPRPALVAAKRAIIDGLRLPLNEGLQLEKRLFSKLEFTPPRAES